MIVTSGINRRVRYAMRESDGYFTIDSESGLISLDKQLDREHTAKFNLTIYAYDQVCFFKITKVKISRHYPLTDCDLRTSSVVLSNIVTSLFYIHQTSPLALHLSQQSGWCPGPDCVNHEVAYEVT